MQHDLVRPLIDHDLKWNFEVDFSKSNYICFESFRRNNDGGAHIIALSLIGTYYKLSNDIRKKMPKNSNYN